jgi:hypothetical protein
MSGNLDLASAMAPEVSPASAQLGPLLRLWGLHTSQLPDVAATPAELAPFLVSLLQEAVPFADSIAPKASSPVSSSSGPGDKKTPRLWRQKGEKRHPDSAAPVTLLERTVPSADLDLLAARHGLSPTQNGRAVPVPETWACRRSVHRDAAAKGTASFAEFRAALKDRHAESEEDFTPGVVGTRHAMEWDCRGVEAEEGGVLWGDFTLRVEEMRHKVGRPLLRDRAFPVLQMTCAAVARPARAALEVDVSPSAQDPAAAAPAPPATATAAPASEFLVVSITVPDFSSSPAAQLSKKTHRVVVGSYASVERVRKLPGLGGDVEWVMATASDAGGGLPMWVQALAVPGQIAKDVPFFLAWMARERSGENAREKEEKERKAKDKDKGGRKKEDEHAVAAIPPPHVPAGGVMDSEPAKLDGMVPPLVPEKAPAPVPKQPEPVVPVATEAALGGPPAAAVLPVVPVEAVVPGPAPAEAEAVAPVAPVAPVPAAAASVPAAEEQVKGKGPETVVPIRDGPEPAVPLSPGRPVAVQ